MMVLMGYFAFLFNNQKTSEHKLRVQNEKFLSEKTIELAKKTAELDDFEKTKSQIEQTFQDKITGLEKALKMSHEQFQQLSLTVDELNKDKADLQKDLAAKQKNIEELNQKIRRSETDRADLVAAIKNSIGDSVVGET